MRFPLTVLMFLFSISLTAQVRYSGRVIDSGTKEILPFVNVTGEVLKHGTTTDIDGQFEISFPAPQKFLRFVYIGYEELIVNTASIANNSELEIKLKRKPVGIAEVVVKAGINPAHRIIKKAVENKGLNDPENLRAFSYESYNKLIVTADSVEQSNAGDSSEIRLRQFLDRNHLFLSESVTLRNYRYKGLNKEKVLASRVSGLKTPLFTLLATQFQSFSFYKDHITVSDKNYLNPLSSGSTNKYIFVLEDTSFSGTDTVYQISFQPKPGKNFEGLKGVLYINTRGYAVQNVIAAPADESGGTEIWIQQQYAVINEKWFPVQLNTDIIFKNIVANGHAMHGNARSYLSSIDIGKALERKEFSAVELEIDEDAAKKNEDFWARYRKDSLTRKDRNTYVVIDSIGKKEKLEEKITAYTSFMTGRYPLGKIDLDLNSLIDFNEHEGYRAGLGVYTNSRLSKRFIGGGYAAWGFRDKELKYGGSLLLKIRKLNQGAVKLNYLNDVIEAGNQGTFIRSNSMLSEDYRRFSVNMMDHHEMAGAMVQFRTFKYLTIHTGLNKQIREPLYIGNERQIYEFSEVQLLLRYAFREKFLQLLGEQVSLGTDKPILWFSLTRGINGLLGGKYEFMRLEAMASYSHLIRNIGTMNFHVKTGQQSGSKALPFLYHLRGTNIDWELYDPEGFQTMGINEFFTDRYLNFIVRHDFGKLLLKSKYFSPSLSIVNAASVFDRRATWSTPFLESGLLVNDVVKVSFLGLGIGGFYRYGYHTLPTVKENLTLKLTVKFNI